MAQPGTPTLSLSVLLFLLLLISLCLEFVFSQETYELSTKEGYLDKRNESLQITVATVTICGIACHQHCCLEFSFYDGM